MSEFHLPGEKPGEPSTSASDGSYVFNGSMSNVVMKTRAGGWELGVEEDEEEWGSDDIDNSHAREKRRGREIKFQEASQAFDTIREALKSEEQVEDLKKRVARAVQRANEAAEIGQTGLSQDLVEIAAGWVIEQQLKELGYGKWIEQSVVRDVVNKTHKDIALTMDSLSRFPRVIPTEVQDVIKTVKSLFTSFTIVYTNPKGQEVRDRDPILFGVLQAFPDRYYYLVDWIDEYCELTMEKFCELGKVHEKWAVNEVMDEPSDEDVLRLLDRVKNGRRMEKQKQRGFFKHLWNRVFG